MTESEIGSSFIPALYKPPALLPIARHERNLLYLIETFPVTIVVGQTGSGKTTQIPQYLERAGWCDGGKVIAITQPRRVAATTVATRVAEEMRCKLGQEVGYSIRFEDATSATTRIKFMTDGMLLREALIDPLLSRYSVIMIDEAHERSMSSDLLLGLLKKIIKRRPELRIVVSSATIQAQSFLDFFSPSAPPEQTEKAKHSSTPGGIIIKLEGRSYPVDMHYLMEAAEDYVQAAVDTVFDIHSKEEKGDILIFMTGREEIETVIEQIGQHSATLTDPLQTLQALPLYAGLTVDQQMYVFEPAPEGVRKVVVATNIAEASVTIDGIVYVIDSGFVKLRAFNPSTNIETLTATPVSKASAIQRSGRAGRTRPGKCYRLYTEEAYDGLEGSTVPEIQRSNLAPVILQLKALGIENVARFDFLTPPPSKLVVRALELLFALGVLDNEAKLTKPLGVQMAELALEPMLGKVLLSAVDFGCLSEMLTIAAMTSLDGSAWFSNDENKKEMESSRCMFAAEEGDHITLLNVYQAFTTKGKKEVKWCREHFLNFQSLSRATSIRNQLKRYLERLGFNITETRPIKGDQSNVLGKAERIRRCLTSGYFSHAARFQPDGTFRTIDGMTVLHAHPSSLMFNRKADWVIFQQVVETSKKTYIKDITKVEKSWLLEYAPHFYQVKKPKMN